MTKRILGSKFSVHTYEHKLRANMLRNKVTRHENDSIHERSIKKIRLHHGFMNVYHNEGKLTRKYHLHAQSFSAMIRTIRLTTRHLCLEFFQSIVA
jgi:hypothetical protein